MKKKTRKLVFLHDVPENLSGPTILSGPSLEDHRLLVEWIDSHLLADIYNMDNYPEDPVGTAEDYV
jgi:hypothetical protein